MGRPGPSPAAYRLLLTLLPEDFRRRWGPDMEDVFALRLREAGSSPVRRLWVWARAVADVAAHAMAEWRSRLSGAPRPPRSWAQDLRYGVTSVLRARGFFAGAALTLALGIAAATATFAVVHAVLLQDLPYPEADRLVVLWPETNGNKSMVGLAEEGMVSVEVASGVSGWALTLNGVGEPAQIQATAVSNAHFDVMGVLPALGRGFQEGDDLPGAAGVVVLAHGFWVSAFGSDPSVIGRVVDMSGAEYDRRTVIGVMPPGYRPFIRGTDVWIPLEGDPSTPLEEDRTWYVNHRLARLRVGATLEQANREIGPHAERIRERLPGVFAEDDPRRATVQPLGAFVAGDTGPVIWVAMGAVSLVLLIACGNVTNLLLARGDAQERAHSIRVALGASRARVARMLMAQNAVIAGAGGLAGAFLARGFLEALIRLAPPDFPRLDEIGFGGPVLAYATVATAVTLAVAGVWPAVRASRAGGTAVLGGGARGSAGVGPGRLSRGLVAAQIALALMVAVGSGLMLRSLTRLASEEVGLDAGQTLTFNPTPPGGRYPTRADFQLYYDQVTERLAALPGVTSVGAIHLLPGTWGNWSFPTYAGAPVPEGEAVPSANFRAVTPGYFQTLRIPVLRGRDLSSSDLADSEPVVVVNQAFARRFWPDEDPLQQQLSVFSPSGTSHRVVGVVGDVRQHDRAVAPLPEMYFTPSQAPAEPGSLWVMVRVAQGQPMAYAEAIRAAVWEIDAEVPIVGMEAMETVLERSTLMTRFLASLLTLFGGLAVGLGAVGVFGVTAFTVGRRTSEFGVRVAIGATRHRVLGVAMRQALWPVALGLLGGLTGALLTTRFLASALYEVPSTDPTTFLGVALLLSATASAACLLPAWRASRVDPVAVLSAD